MLVPLLLDGAARVEVDLVGHQRRSDQPDHEVPVDARAAGLGNEALPDLRPVRIELDRSRQVDEQGETEVAEDPLDAAERQEVDGGRHRHQRDQDEEANADVEEVVEDEPEPAELRGKGQHREEERRDQRERSTAAGRSAR